MKSRMELHKARLEAALSAIGSVGADTTVSEETTLNSLEELLGDIESRITALKEQMRDLPE